ncbi:MAG: CHAT domain-containing protein [Candidatus Thorarchaeota archaeon]|nr:CHAT domain-containing protein [Candidatus Thorarchaeota archaeon]
MEYNEDYGDRLTINVATGTAATLTRMKTYISTTERMHLSSHGTWNSEEGSKITMYGGYLTHQEVSSWSLTGGICKFIYLSACNSMGHNGILDTDLANELRLRTSIEAVIGFKDVANILGATLLSQSFWGFHVAYEYIGGISTATSYTNTLDRIQFKIDLIRLGGSITISVAIGYLVSLAMSGIGAGFISAVLSGIISLYLLGLLLDEVQATLNSCELVGTNVPGLYWPSGGGGGGGKPPVDVID